MMEAQPMYKGKTMKQVIVTGIEPGHTEDEVLRVALVAAREDRSSLWGWTVAMSTEDKSRAIVTMHTD